MSRVTEIRYVGYGVPDLAAERAFYAETWGLREVAERDGLVYFAAEGSDNLFVVRLRAAAEPAGEKLLVVACEGVEFGLMIDHVLGLRAVAAARLGGEVPGLDGRHLRGLTPDGLIVLDLPALLPALTVGEAPGA